MSKPEDIPQDVAKLAAEAVKDFPEGVLMRPDQWQVVNASIVRAIMAERERCCRHAKSYLIGLADKGAPDSLRRIVNDAVVGTAEGISVAIKQGEA